MSHIFDALQRSEAERSGHKAPSAPSITDLLERAERGAAARLDSPVDEEALASDPSVLLAAEASLRSVADYDAAVAPADFDACERITLSLAPESRLVTVSNSDSPAAEAFRLLSVRLRHMRRDRSLKKLLITSTIPQEGKSTLAANLACSLASATRRRILLLEGDVRRPTLSRIFNLDSRPGLCECLAENRSLVRSLYRLDPAGIWLCPAGKVPANPLELLESGRLPVLLDELTAWFDWIVIDSPPVLPLADTSVWTRFSDGILMVTRQGTTQKRHLQRGLEAIETKKFLGTVLNSSRNTSDNKYYSYRRSSEDAAE